MKPQYYVLTVIGDVEPVLSKPFDSEDERDKEAQECRKEDPELLNAIFSLRIDENGVPTVDTYSNQYLTGENNE